MADLHPQDAANPREGCSTTLKELQEYRERALRIVNDSDNKLFQGNVKHPWSDDLSWESQVHVFELEGDHTKDPRQFDNANDMIEYWENTPKDGTEATTNRRIFLLEGMEPGVVELLGVKLGIPPQFFLAHCDHFVDLRVIDSSFAQQNSSTYWKVPVKQYRKLPSNVPCGSYFLETGNCYRREVTIEEDIGYVMAESFVSYWGMSYGQHKSWTALILMDPREMSLRSVTDPSDPLHELEELHFERDVVVEVMASSEVLGHKTIQPAQRDMFKSAVQAHSAKGIRILHTEDPFSGTMFIRNLIRSAWEESITREAVNIRGQLLDDRLDYQARMENIAKLEGSDDGIQPNRAYFKLMMQRQSIQEDKDSIVSVMRRIRCWNADDMQQDHKQQEVVSQEVSQQINPSEANPGAGTKMNQQADQKSSTSQTRSRNIDVATGNKARFQELLSEEKQSWKMIYETVCKMESNVAEHMEMWSQRAALEQAATSLKLATEANKQTIEAQNQTAEANRMARTSGQLTKIATIIVPCTFVGSIFSMGGRFAAGEDLFFVYWAITVPVTVMLLAWVLHHDIQASYEKMRRKYKGSREHGSTHGEAEDNEKMVGQSATQPEAKVGNKTSLKQRRQNAGDIV